MNLGASDLTISWESVADLKKANNTFNRGRTSIKVISLCNQIEVDYRGSWNTTDAAKLPQCVGELVPSGSGAMEPHSMLR